MTLNKTRQAEACPTRILRKAFWEKYVEAGAVSGAVFQADRSAMVVHDFCDDRQAKTYAILLRCEKRVENLLAGFQRHTGTGVLDGHTDSRSAARDFRGDRQAQRLRRGAILGLHGLQGVAD